MLSIFLLYKSESDNTIVITFLLWWLLDADFWVVFFFGGDIIRLVFSDIFFVIEAVA